VNTNKLKSAVLAATTIAVALSVGFAAPATAMPMTIETNIQSVVRNGELLEVTSTVPEGYTAATFINGENFSTYPWSTQEPVSWNIMGPCVTVDVTFRVYRDIYVDQVKTFDDAYGATVTIQWIGDNTVDCNPAWGEGETADELAPTGSDASTVAGMTGVAGVAALAVAVAVARRTRRAQR
jgi:hypothetical protein